MTKTTRSVFVIAAAAALLLVAAVAATAAAADSADEPAVEVASAKDLAEISAASEQLETTEQTQRRAHDDNNNNNNADGQFARAVRNVRKLLDWREYQRKFDKHYKSATERAFRLREFVARAARAVARMFAYKSGRSSFYTGINQYSDRSRDERKRLFGGEPDIVSELTRRRRDVQADSAAAAADATHNGGNVFGRMMRSIFGRAAANKPQRKQRKVVDDRLEVDWRTAACMRGSVRNQRDCGCCYAMASTKLMEYEHCVQHELAQPRKFSEQFMVDCGESVGLGGCTSGTTNKALRFIKQFGLVDDARHPFAAKQQQCPAHLLSDSSSSTDNDNTRVQNFKLDLLKRHEWSEHLRARPLLVHLRLSDEFVDYAGGLYEVDKCAPDMGHFMLVVGEGKETYAAPEASAQEAAGEQPDEQDYWLMLNSYGAQWGVQGHVKIKRDDTSECITYAVDVHARF